MKVLWFSNTPANADEYYNSELKGTGGWLKALDQKLQKHVELHIAYYKNSSNVFKYGETTYHPIDRNEGLFKKLMSRYTNNIIDDEHLEKYLSILNGVKPDIIHIHGTENPFGCIIPHTKIPVVISIQGIIATIHNKYCGSFEKKHLRAKNRSTRSLKDLFFPHSFLLGYKSFYKMGEREKRNLKLAKFVMGRTSFDQRVSRMLAPNSIYFKDNRVLRPVFYEQKPWSPLNNEKTILHTTTGSSSYKGFETLCAALNGLNKYGFNCEWHVAGISPNDLIVKIAKRKLKKNYPSKGLVLLGKLNERSLIEHLLSCDIYVMTSHIDNSPNALCEAMYLGIPCISTFVGGVGSLIKDREEGLLIQSGDPWVMAGAILELANDQQLAVRLGQNARKTALIRHDRERIVLELIKTYETIIQNELIAV